MKYVKKPLSVMGLVVMLGSFGLFTGTVVQRAVSPKPAVAYCEHDYCEEWDWSCFDTAGTLDYNCDMLPDGSCADIPCGGDGGGPERM